MNSHKMVVFFLEIDWYRNNMEDSEIEKDIVEK